MAKGDLIPSRGAVAEPLLMEVSRELKPDDLLRLADAPKVNVPVLQKLRATHHRQAQLLAQGKTVGEVAMIVGCTPQRLTQLQSDPTFSDLVTYYQDQIMVLALEDGARMRDKIVDVGEMAVDELRERLENDAKRQAMPVGEIRKIAEFAMDRTVAPPKAAPQTQTAPTQVTISFGTPIRAPDDAPMIEGKAEKLEE
jgi:hypothetical protein